MKKKIFAFAVVVALLVSLVGQAAGAPAGGPKPWTEGIPVDADPYYKSLGLAATAAIVEADTAPMQDVLASQVGTGAAVGVGDVKWLYADGWQQFTLQAIGGNAEIWVANDLSYCPGDPRPPHVVTQEQVDYLFDQFNTVIYPSNTDHFGFTEDRYGTSGVFASWGYDWYETDNPQRVMVLVYNIVDEGYCDPEYPFYVAGYFWATMNDVYADRNIIHIDSGDWSNRIGPDVARPYLYEGVIAHEYEHAIHYDHDPDEPSWVDEGLACMSGFYAGYGHSAGAGHLAYYLVYHRWPLVQWLGTLQDYGESYLFQIYLDENFGGPAFIKALVDEQANGIEGIENQLAAFGETASFNDIYRDWTLANYLDDPSLTGNSGAQLGYDSLDIPSDDTWGYSIQWSIKNYYGSDNTGNLPIQRYWGGYKSGTVQWPVGDLPPYAPMYLTYKGFEPKLNAYFRGNNTTGVAPYQGDYEYWGGKGDLMFNTMTLASPITLGADATLSFRTWYQIEALWDFGFAQIHIVGDIDPDTGEPIWTSLENPDTTYEHDPQAHPNVLANLPGFTGSSDGWKLESFDLSGYAGQTVLLRFLYVTDWAYTEAGWYVDEITINGFTDDAEGGWGAWVLDGWEWTTGLAVNDWALTFIDPNYQRGRFVGFDIVDVPMDVVTIPDKGVFQIGTAVLDTLNLNKDMVTAIVSNHLPEEASFESHYLFLVEKGRR